MAQQLFHFSMLLLVLALAAMQGAHAVEYVVTDNSGDGGVRFRNEIGVDYSRQAMSSATDFIWSTFRQDNPADRKDFPGVTLFIDEQVILNNMPVPAATGDNAIHVSASYLGDYQGDLKPEFTGVLYHEMTHVWQWNGNNQAPGGLIEGIADFVRLRANYIPSHWAQPGQGDRWDQGYDFTARFLDYCDGLMNGGFVAELNKKMRTGYSDQYFVDLLGKTVDQLWSDYKATFDN